MTHNKNHETASTDNFKEIYRVPGVHGQSMDYYQPSIDADGELIRIRVGGKVITRTIYDLHSLAWNEATFVERLYSSGGDEE